MNRARILFGGATAMPRDWDRIVSRLGDAARPFCLYVSGASSAIATVWIVAGGLDLLTGAAYITAAWAGTAALYGAKALEEGRKAKVDGEVKVAQANAAAPPPGGGVDGSTAEG